MLLRRDGDTVLCIAQPSHAWLSGQLARLWGNERFGAVVPNEEVCLAAEQHDIGWLDWEAAPVRDPETGLPYSFMAVPLEEHLRMWTVAPPRIFTQSRYAALLVSMHGTALYARRDRSAMPPADAARVEAFLEAQAAFQDALAADLGAGEAELRRNQRLLWTWDGLSLGVLLGWAPHDFKAVPAIDEPVTIALRERDGVHTLDPWPLSVPAATVRCEARRVPAEGAPGDAALERLLAEAPWETLEVRLEPAA